MNRPPFQRVARACLPILMAGAAASAALADVTSDPMVLTPTVPGGGTPDIHALAGGDLFANLQKGLAVLIDGGGSDSIVDVFHDPAVLDAHADAIPGHDPTGLARLSAPAAGDPAPLVVTTIAGLQLLEPEPTSGGYGPPTLLRGNPWPLATRLRTCTLGGDEHVFAISWNTRKVLSAYDSGGGQWVEGPVLSFTQPVLDYACVDIDDDSVIEIAVLFADRIEVYEQGGQLNRVVFGSPTTNSALARVRLDAGDELLAWVTVDGTGSPELRLFNSSVTEPVVQLSIDTGGTCGVQNVTPAGLVAGDVNGDGNDDLVLTDAASRRAVLFRNQGSGPQHFSTNTLDGDHFLLLPPAADPCVETPGDDCPPVIDDIDGDGLNDIALALEGLGQVLLFASAGANQLGGGSEQATGDFVLPDLTFYSYVTPASPDYFTIRLALNYSSISTAYPNLDHVDLTLYFQESKNDPVGSSPVAQHAFSFITGVQEPNQVAETPLNFPGAPNQAGWQPEIVYVRMRFVALSFPPVGQPKVTDSSQSFMMAIQMNGPDSSPPPTDPDADFPYLASLSPHESGSYLSSLSQDSNKLGGFYLNPRPPGFLAAADPNTFPNPVQTEGL